MKKIAASFLLVSLLFGLDFTFIKIFHNFKKGVRLYKKDPIKAQKYFSRAYALIQKSKLKNSSQIQYFLGRMYYNGWGVPKDYKKAEKHLLKAISLGNRRAYCCLAKVYIKEGRLKEAKKYLELALSNPILARACNDIDLNLLKIKGE